MSLIRTVSGLATSLHLRTIAEGVETDGQLAFLMTNGCGAMQGYYFSRPLPVADMSAALRDGKQLDIAGLRRGIAPIQSDSPTVADTVPSSVPNMSPPTGFHEFFSRGSQ